MCCYGWLIISSWHISILAVSLSFPLIVCCTPHTSSVVCLLIGAVMLVYFLFHLVWFHLCLHCLIDPYCLKVKDHGQKTFTFRYMKIHIFALRWKDEIRRSLQLRTLLKHYWTLLVLFTTTRFSSVLSCKDLLISNFYFFPKQVMFGNLMLLMPYALYFAYILTTGNILLVYTIPAHPQNLILALVGHHSILL